MPVLKYTQKDLQEMKALKAQGLTYQQIGDQMGISRGIVTWMFNRKSPLPTTIPKSKRQNATSNRSKGCTGATDYFKHDPYYKY